MQGNWRTLGLFSPVDAYSMMPAWALPPVGSERDDAHIRECYCAYRCICSVIEYDCALISGVLAVMKSISE